jgi:hypothetical protein
MIQNIKVLDAVFLKIVTGGLCDCYCYPSNAAESKLYTQLPHPQRCRNYCLMNGLRFDKCVYGTPESIWT